ncbi:MAG TPA: hypothetical protein VNO20_08665 [Solirubrobacterales bacterium]|nr:hypothetical protein [Solirubrobacterales bacterium]
MKRIAASIVFAIATLLGVAVAQGEQAQEGNLRVSFDGRLAPRALPRDRPAPVTAYLESSIRTVDGSTPPPLRRISIAVNRQGLVSFAGLPTCNPAELQQTSTEAALNRCRPALIGRGRFAADVTFPGAAPYPAQGRALIFNGRSRGRPAAFLHIFSSNPIRITFVLPFEIRRQRGQFGTVFSAAIPQIAADTGYITDIELTVGREYRYRGDPRSFLSASCAAPPGFHIGFFTLARTTFSFADGRTLTTEIARDCRVR